MARVILLRAVLIVLALACYAHAFYLPGVAPIEYNTGDRVYLSVNQLTSVHTQLPMRYYTLPFCRPETIEDDRENLGELLLGDRIENSPYLVLICFPSSFCASTREILLISSHLVTCIIGFLSWRPSSPNRARCCAPLLSPRMRRTHSSKPSSRSTAFTGKTLRLSIPTRMSN